MGIMQAKGWLKGIAVGAAFAALVALPMFSMSAGKVSYSDLSYGGGGGAGKVIFQDLAVTVGNSGGCPDPNNCTKPGLASGKVSFQDIHFAKVQTQDFHFVM